jgi:hypothetical protein
MGDPKRTGAAVKASDFASMSPCVAGMKRSARARRRNGWPGRTFRLKAMPGSERMRRLFLVLAALAVLSPAGAARAQGLAVNPSAAASDVRNPSSINPAAAASDVRNPSAINPAAAASAIRQPDVASPNAPAGVNRRAAPPRDLVRPERRPRAVRASRGGRAARETQKAPSRPAAERARPATAADRKAQKIMGSVCRGC